MKKCLLASVGVLALSACGETPQTKTNASTQAGVEKVTEAETPDTPELGDFGVETKFISDSLNAGDDFYRYASEGWLDTFEIPEEFSRYGSFTVLFERSEKRVRNIIETAAKNGGAAGSVEQKIGDFFASYTDIDAINAAGLEVLASRFEQINAAASIDDIARIMGDPAFGTESVLGGWVNIDSKDTSRYIFYISQAGLGLPNRDYYLEEKFADKREKYKAYIEQILTLANIDGAKEKAAAIYAAEEEIAKVHWEPAKRRNRDLTYNFKTKEELKSFAPEMPWDAFFSASGLEAQNQFVVREDDAIANIGKILAQTPIDVWKDYLTFHLIQNNADVLPTRIDEATFAFYGTELRGTPKQRERWKRGVAAVNGALGEAVGKVYVDKYFPASSKDQMEDLVANLRLALDERLDTLPWMGEATKQQAHAKLEKFTPKIGYPDKWKDYSALEVIRGDAFQNKQNANVWAWNDQVSKLGGPIDKTEWFMNPQTINAYYSPVRNEIVFPAAILQAPFFDPAADPAVNYGGIGAVIGHEIGHGFDDQGRKSDGNGLLRDWWTEEDAANFQLLADKLGAQYSVYEPIKGFKVNPKLTMGENIGDVGGLAMAYHAYKLSLNGEEAPVINGFTGDQRFFLAWAQVWKRVVRDEALKNQIATDPHSPARYRVNGVVRNMDEWYEAFGVEEGDDLYLAPEDRVKIW